MIFEGTTCKAEYIESKEIVYFDLIGYANVEEYKTMFHKVFNFMKLHRVKSFVHNFKKVKGTFANLNEWIVSELTPAIDLGLKNDAMIVREDIYSSFPLRDINRRVALPVKLQMFVERRDAEVWAAEAQ